jgi:hypothetical protein
LQLRDIPLKTSKTKLTKAVTIDEGPFQARASFVIHPFSPNLGVGYKFSTYFDFFLRGLYP